MSTVLIVDDDLVREEKLTDFWKRQPITDIVWVTSWPNDFLGYLESHPEITHLSLDHDLGSTDGTDVSLELVKLSNNDYTRFAKAFSNKHILVHSMNPIGAKHILYCLENDVASITIVPFYKL